MTQDPTAARPHTRTGAPAPTRGRRPDPDLHDVVALGTRRGLAIWSERNSHPHTRADHVADLSDAEVRDLVALLDPAAGRSLLASIDTHTAADVLRVCPPPVAAGLLESLPTDLAATLLRELGETERARVLAATDLARSAVARGRLAWPAGSAAARMAPHPVTVRPTATVREAVGSVRGQAADAGTHGPVYVTDPVGERSGAVGEALVGAVTLPELELADQDLRVADVMRADVVTVDALADREEAAQVLRAHRPAALPVIDDGLLLGVLAVDDVEPAARTGGQGTTEVALAVALARRVLGAARRVGR